MNLPDRPGQAGGQVCQLWKQRDAVDLSVFRKSPSATSAPILGQTPERVLGHHQGMKVFMKFIGR